jgi:hypothetical protein
MMHKREKLQKEIEQQETILSNLQRQGVTKRYTGPIHDRIYELKLQLDKMGEKDVVA